MCSPPIPSLKSVLSRWDFITKIWKVKLLFTWTHSKWPGLLTAQQITTSAPTSLPGFTEKSMMTWPTNWIAMQWSVRANWRLKSWLMPWWWRSKKPSTVWRVMGESTRTTPTKRRLRDLNRMTAEHTWSCSRIRHLQSGAAAAGERSVLGMGPWNTSWTAFCKELQYLRSCIYMKCLLQCCFPKNVTTLFFTFNHLQLEPDGYK